MIKLRAAAAVVFVCIGGIAFFYPKSVSGTDTSDMPSAAPTPRPKVNRTNRPARYSQFPHDVKSHRIDCGSCHKFPSPNWQKVRAASDAFPDVTDYPRHESCLNCHKQQFFKGRPPAICSICHTNPSPNVGTRHAFPNPREIFDATPKGKTAVSDFAVSFPHDKHIEIVSKNKTARVRFENAAWTGPSGRGRAEESCSVCHKTYNPQGDSDDEYFTKPPADLGDAFWLKKGTFKTTPIGHTTCFTCHSADSGLSPAPTDCATCHKLKMPGLAADFDNKLAAKMGVSDRIMLASWRRRASAGKFRHEWFAHAELACSTCHNVLTLNTADPSTAKVSISACATCHATAKSDGGGALNLESDSRRADAKFQCVKCHITFGKSAIPESHLKAIEGAK